MCVSSRNSCRVLALTNFWVHKGNAEFLYWALWWLFSWFVGYCRWLGDFSCFLIRWRWIWKGRENGKSSAVGEIGLTLGTRVCCQSSIREAHPGTHKTSSAPISAACLGFFWYGAYQVEVWERCLVKWNWSRTIKGFWQGSVFEAQICSHMLSERTCVF